MMKRAHAGSVFLIAMGLPDPTVQMEIQMSAKPTNSLFNVDPSALFAQFKVPGVDVESILATQRKNIEALTKANQVAVEGMQAIGRRQVEIIRSALTDSAAQMRDLFQNLKPEERVAKQAEIAKKGLEKAIADARELAEIVSKAQNEAFEVLNKRLTESLDEVKTLVTKK
jgi:phasin family protein